MKPPSFTQGQLYGRAWQKRARLQLRQHPLCAICLQDSKVVPAQCADHVTPHRGDINIFWQSKLRSLCWACHSSEKQILEKGGKVTRIGPDGYPIDYTFEDYARET
jgi:hypothetical protein